MKKLKISVCSGKSCHLRNSHLLAIVKNLRDENGQSFDSSKVQLDRCGCIDQCIKGPNILIEDLVRKQRIIRNGVTPARLRQEITRLENGQCFADPPKNTRKTLNDYLSGGL